jgi:outer membrane lipoprotein SlyB
MKIRMLVVSALAGLAVSGVPASAASAEESSQSKARTAQSGGIGPVRHGKPKRRRHKPKRHAQAEIALAKTFSAR